MKQFYYEFNENEYYTLIAVSIDENDLYTRAFKKAIEIYIENVSGSNIDEVLEEGSPNERTKEYAFMKFMYAPNNQKSTVKELIQEFESVENGVLLIDGALI
jgi:hypothetical protein